MSPPLEPTITLRPVVPEDGPFLYEVYASTRQEELAVLPWTEEQKQAFLRMQFEAQRKFYWESFPQADFLVVLRDGEAAGRLYVDRRPDADPCHGRETERRPG